MARKLVIHLGDRKTGSTSIQAAMRGQIWQGGPSLAYPVRGLHHGRLTKKLAKGVPERQRRKVFLKQKRLLEETAAEVAVISTEHFEAVDPLAFKQAMKTYIPGYEDGMRLIAYVRPHVDRVVSSWAERTKLGLFYKPLEDFAKEVMTSERFLYFERFRRWQDIFSDRFELRPMIRSHLYGRCVVRDFLSYALETENFEMLEEPAANESMSVEDLIILAQMHEVFSRSNLPEMVGDSETLQVLGRNLAIELAGMPQKQATKVRAHKSLVRQMQAAYAADASALDAHFFEGYSGAPMSDALEEASSKASGSPFSFEAGDYFSEDLLRTIEAWARMICRMAEVSPQDWSAHFVPVRLEA